MRLFVYFFVLAVLRNCFAIPIPSGPSQSGSSGPFLCRKGCENRYEKKGGRTAHEKIHTVTEPLICRHTNCDDEFKSSSGRSIHEGTHTSDSFPCGHNGCPIILPDKAAKIVHRRTHSELWLPVVLNDNSPLHRKREKYRAKTRDVSNMWYDVL